MTSLQTSSVHAETNKMIVIGIIVTIVTCSSFRVSNNKMENLVHT